MLNLLKAFPHLRAVVQDLKAAVEDGEQVIEFSVSCPPCTDMYSFCQTAVVERVR